MTNHVILDMSAFKRLNNLILEYGSRDNNSIIKHGKSVGYIIHSLSHIMEVINLFNKVSRWEYQIIKINETRKNKWEFKKSKMFIKNKIKRDIDEDNTILQTQSSTFTKLVTK